MLSHKREYKQQVLPTLTIAWGREGKGTAAGVGVSFVFSVLFFMPSYKREYKQQLLPTQTIAWGRETKTGGAESCKN